MIHAFLISFFEEQSPAYELLLDDLVLAWLAGTVVQMLALPSRAWSYSSSFPFASF